MTAPRLSDWVRDLTEIKTQMESVVPEPSNRIRGLVDGWRLRTKVAVVLVVPAVVALVLGVMRIETQYADASRLSAVRDQLRVVHAAVGLTDRLAGELAGGPRADTAALRQAADHSGLPDDAVRTLGDALGRLDTLRANPGDPVARAAGFRQVITGISDLVPDVLGAAGDRGLDDQAGDLRSLLRLRGALASQESLLARAPLTEPAARAAQHAAADEAVLADLVGLRPATDRRDAIRAGADPRPLLPALAAQTTALTTTMTTEAGLLGAAVDERTRTARAEALTATALVLGALLIAFGVALVVARSLLSPMRRLRTAVLAAAHVQLPDVVDRVRAGEDVDWQSVAPVPVRTGEEIGELARAFDDMHRQAVRLASEQAELRRQVSDMFMTLSRRSQSLVESQLDLIESLEADEQDPDRLAGLFRLDHLATRLRRNGENLQVLAGGAPVRHDQGPVSVVELLHAATSEVNDYRRIALGNAPNGSVRACAAADVVHILAELLENAARFSPPDHKVVLTADRATDGGLLVEVVDAGLGMTEEDLAGANDQLAATDAVSPETARRMGLFVVSRLAAQHGVTVRLRRTFENQQQTGITASVHLPGSLVVTDGIRPVIIESTVEPPAPRSPTRTPIFDQLVSNWFAPPQDGADWHTPADDAWRAGAATINHAPAAVGTSPVGLPMRKPGGRPAPAARQRATDGVTRDPDAVRGNLSRHYRGVRAARDLRRPRTDPREGT